MCIPYKQVLAFMWKKTGILIQDGLQYRISILDWLLKFVSKDEVLRATIGMRPTTPDITEVK